MPISDENQMIGQIDTDRPQEKRSVARCGDIGVARPGDARGVVMRHYDGRGTADQQRAPASRRDDAASRRFAVDAFETDQSLKRVKGSKEYAFPIIDETGAQQLPRDRAFGVARHKARTHRGGMGFADGFEDRHHRRMAQASAGPNCRLRRIGRIGGAVPANPLSPRGAGPSNDGERKGARLG